MSDLGLVCLVLKWKVSNGELGEFRLGTWPIMVIQEPKLYSLWSY